MGIAEADEFGDLNILQKPTFDSPRSDADILPQMPVNRRVISTVGVVSICFFVVCGGPIGSEQIVSAGGPLLGILGLLCYPLICSAPFSYVVAELCTVFPEDGGFSVWVMNAWGPFWGFQVGYWSWVAGILNRAMFPGLIYGILSDSFGWSTSKMTEYFINAGIAVVLTLPVLMGVRFAVQVKIALMLCVLLPVVVFTIWAFGEPADMLDVGEIRRSNITIVSDKEYTVSGDANIDWSLYLNALFWSYHGFYLASVFGGEVSYPAFTYPRALLISFVLTCLAYFFPFMAAMVANKPHWSTYDEDSFPTIGQAIGGDLLHGMILFASFCGAVGLYMAQLFCEAFLVCGMAESGLIAPFFKKRNARFDTPHNSIFFSLILILLLSMVDFETMLGMTNAFTAAVEIMIVATAIQLRRTLPFVPRPIKVPGGLVGLCVILIIPTLTCSIVIVNVFRKPFAAVIVVALLIAGFIYGGYNKCRKDDQLAGDAL